MRYRRPTCYVNGKQRLVSRVTVERHTGRDLRPEEIVHHIDGNPFNNELANLQVVTRAEHKRIHADVGAKTRFEKQWVLDPDTIWQRLQAESARQIARSIGCSGKTVTRAVSHLMPRGTSFVTLMSQRMRGKPRNSSQNGDR